MRPWIVALAIVAFLVNSGCADTPAFTPAKADKGETKYVGKVPVLLLQGTPEEMGTEEAKLVGTNAGPLLSFGPTLVSRIAGPTAWKAHVIVSKALLQNVAPRHVAEMTAFQKTSGLSNDDLIASQMLYDTVNSFGCSSILVPADRSATGGPLMGRNFDYASFGLLHASDLVKVYKPEEKFSFAAVSFPGCFGVISGMNEHGLVLALHEVRHAADNSPRFNAEGVPTLLLLREVLEECRTVEEAKQWLTDRPRTTMFNLALCDPKGGAVMEVTVDNVKERRVTGINACTNHFRADDLSVTKECDRFDELMRPIKGDYSVAQVFSKLDAVKQGEKTFQSMVFEPRNLILHVAIETRPSTQGTLRQIELRPLFK